MNLHSRMTSREYLEWLEQAAPGTSCIYHTGLLMFDRSPEATSSPWSTEQRADIDALASMVVVSAESRLAKLFQRRRGENDYDYIAVRTTKQWEL